MKAIQGGELPGIFNDLPSIKKTVTELSLIKQYTH